MEARPSFTYEQVVKGRIVELYDPTLPADDAVVVFANLLLVPFIKDHHFLASLVVGKEICGRRKIRGQPLNVMDVVEASVGFSLFSNDRKDLSKPSLNDPAAMLLLNVLNIRTPGKQVSLNIPRRSTTSHPRKTEMYAN